MMEFLGDERTRAPQACKGAFTILSFGMGVGDEAGADCTIMDEPSRVPSLIFFGFSLGIASARSVFGWDLLDRWSKGRDKRIYFARKRCQWMAQVHGGVGSSLLEATA
ncbi:hypothetical protein FSOLCH5_005332 [Fusarium solani]